MKKLLSNPIIESKELVDVFTLINNTEFFLYGYEIFRDADWEFKSMKSVEFIKDHLLLFLVCLRFEIQLLFNNLSFILILNFLDFTFNLKD